MSVTFGSCRPYSRNTTIKFIILVSLLVKWEICGPPSIGSLFSTKKYFSSFDHLSIVIYCPLHCYHDKKCQDITSIHIFSWCARNIARWRCAAQVHRQRLERQWWLLTERPSLIQNSINKYNSDTQICRSLCSVLILWDNNSIICGPPSTESLFQRRQNCFCLNRCLLSTALLPWQKYVKVAPQFTFFKMCMRALHDEAVWLKNIDIGRKENGESWHGLDNCLNGGYLFGTV